MLFRSKGGLSGVTTGLKDMDRMLGGMHPSDLVILAGRPSMGKTALVTNMAFNAAKAYFESGGKDGAPVAFFSRSEERRVGNEWVSTCRSRWSRDPEKKN